MQLAIVRFSGGWRVLENGRRRTWHAYRVDAEEAALRLARSARTRGETVEVYIQWRDGQLRPAELEMAEVLG